MSEAEAAPAAASGAADAVLRSIGLDLSADADGNVCLNGKQIRSSSCAPKVVSIFDVIRAVNKGTVGAAQQTWAHLTTSNPEVSPSIIPRAPQRA